MRTAPAMRAISIIWISALLGYVFYSSSGACSEKSEVGNFDVSTISVPSSSSDLLRNFQVAIDENLFFQKDLISSDEFLWRVSSGAGFYRYFPQDPRSGNVRIEALSSDVDAFVSDPHKIRDERTAIVFSTSDRRIHINIYPTLGLQLNRRLVEELWGYSSTPVVMHPDISCSEVPGFNCPPSPVLHKIAYKLNAPPSERAIATVGYDRADAVMEIAIDIIMEEKK